MNEEWFWCEYGLDPYEIAARLYREFGGDGGKPKPRKAIKPRKPPHLRQKIRSRPFKQKVKEEK
jgi:hypothetical protein